MINKTLFTRELKANYKIILIFLAVLTMYASMIVTMFDPKFGESLETMAESMPEIFAAFGMTNIGATLIEFIGNYLYGFIFIVFPLIFIILIANRLIARYVDRGSMAFLLATPNKRRKIATTQAVFMITSIFCLVLYVTVFCISVSEGIFPGKLDIRKFILINVGLLGLLFFLGGLCFFASSVFNDIKLSSGLGAGFSIAFVLIQMISQVGEKFENLKYATPLTLFDVDGLIKGEQSSIWMFLILYIVGIILYILGISIFCKRDLSI